MLLQPSNARRAALGRGRILAITIASTLAAVSPSVSASPGITRTGSSQPSSGSRDAALAKLERGEAMVQGDQPGDGLVLMVEAYFELETLDGAEARGVKELRSWLVKVLDGAGMPDEAATLRQRGSYVDHPISVMPSTWFSSSSSGGAMTSVEATTAVEQGLAKLEKGDIQGLELLLEAYEVIEREQGPESEDSRALRGFLVGFLEVGGFQDEANILRARGSVAPMTEEDRQVHVAVWTMIIEAEQKGQTIGGGLSASDLKSGLTGLGSGSGSSTPPPSNPPPSNPPPSNPPPEEPEDPYKPKVFQPGSAVPSVMFDLGIATFRPQTGDKGFLWTLGLSADWNLFRVKFFGLGLGIGGLFGRNRDKRWLTDVYGRLALPLDFQKLYLVPEFGGGMDGLTGGDATRGTDETGFPLPTLRIAPEGYYHFGGTLGVRFSDAIGMYGRAIRLNRLDDVMTNETRGRVGFLFHFDKVKLDVAFTITDYVSSRPQGGARSYGLGLGLGF